MSGIDVSAATEVSAELVEAFARLTPQLSSSSPPPTEDELRRIIDHDACTLLVARDGDRIVGSLTLVVFPIPTGVRAWIEDVVVDEAVGGKGIGKALTKAAIEHAAEHDARTVDLTSRPSREAANGMYQRLGFELRDTNVYRFTGPQDT